MKITFDTPLNIGDDIYCVRNCGEKLDKCDIDIVNIRCFALDENGIFVLDNILDWYGNISNLDKPISETEEGEFAIYSTMENAINAIEEWNSKYVETE